MLGVTTNQSNTTTINNAVADYCASGAISSAAGYGAADIMDDEAELLLEEELMMDPLFEEDWLQENNLDILFDLFEEEIESKVGADSNNASSTLFGTSPVTSYLLGNSPTLASTLDLIYFDNQQQPLHQHHQLLHHQHQQLQQQQQLFQQQQLTAGVHAMNVSSYNNTAISPAYIPAAPTISTPPTHSITNSQATPVKHIAAPAPAPTSAGKSKSSGNGRVPKPGGAQQVNKLTNAMRIKRGLKKGQSEGTSLLAKPCSSNSGSKSNGGSTCSNSSSSCHSKINNNNSRNKFNNLATTTTTTSKNISDKTSAKVTNFKSSIIIGNANNNEMKRNGIDINYSKQSQQLNRERYYLHKCQQHVHYITGRSVIQEHAYAVRGH